ncbi:MAG: 30S ribosomal protein S6 [Deltaproteobacteria bacterium]|nr:MAG: 30S ribosomal protein S6 [Deltaproteobacteria bacterium]
MREYEYVYVLKPEVNDTFAKNFMLKMKHLVIETRGKSLRISCWGKRWLAWKRKGYRQGIFVCHHFLGNSGVIEKYEEALNSSNMILLKQCILLKKNVNQSVFREQFDAILVPHIREVVENTLDY